VLWLEIINDGTGTEDKASYKISLKVTDAKRRVSILHENIITNFERRKGAYELLKIATALICDEQKEPVTE